MNVKPKPTSRSRRAVNGAPAQIEQVEEETREGTSRERCTFICISATINKNARREQAQHNGVIVVIIIIATSGGSWIHDTPGCKKARILWRLSQTRMSNGP